MLSFIQNRWVYIVGILFSILNAYLFYKDFYFLSLLPFALIVIYGAFFNLDKLLLFTVFCTPLSLNLEQLDIGGIGAYLPTEPILFGIMCIFLFKLFFKEKEKANPVLKHPITLAILFHLFWVFITAITSEIPLVSFKFLLTRLWFIIPIYFLGIQIFKHNFKNISAFIWAYLIPLTVVLLVTVIKHAGHGFSEEAGHWIMSPFFKDHTSYGAIIALFYPIVVSLFLDQERTAISRALIGVILLIFTVALFYSYTRAAWLSVVGAFMVYLLFVFKIKFKYLLYLGLVLGSFIILNFTELMYMLQKNDAEHTTENFSERIESMSNMSTDASNLERLNRWSCAIRMFEERPVFGWGPGVYSFQYAPFQDPADLTIISTNFGTGGNAHSEYLGPLAEQGVLGALSMILLVIAIFYTASKRYIELEDKAIKRILMMVMLGLVTYFTHGVLNNYLDTDKASVPVWGFAAIIVSIDLFYKKEKTTTSRIDNR
ncbi:MAG: O-antigen ligase family protein [Flavobacteriales bacterium]|nr:O-antigen ligase family protein [Flavobacteriales bacterium]